MAMYLINYGICPTSDLHVAGYFFVATFKVDKE